jgi:oxygen-dependent protoporphyrinogen oxidase
MSAGGSERRDVIVVGGGISGLTTAWHLARGGLDVALLEAGPRVGGSIVTHADGDWLFELGPNTVLENNPHVGPLVDAAGLGADKLVATSAGKRRYLWKRGRLQPLPAGPLSFLRTRLFSATAKARIAREPFVRPPPDDREESVAQFVRRRLGQEMLDYAVGPFVSGVYAGDPERLSVQWATAKIHALEKQHGGLIKGALAKRKGPAPSGHMITIRQGLDALPARLAAGIPVVRTSTACRRVRRDDDGTWRVDTDDGSLTARRVVLAVPADALARLLDEATEGDARLFDEMPYAPIVLTALGFRREDVAHPLDGFGFLAPRCESLRILGCLFPSSLFPGRAPAGHVALTAFAGGRTDPAIVELDDDRVVGLVTAELRRALGTRAAPVAVHVRRWPRAIPQYEVGHGRFVARARELEARLPGLSIGGNVLGGVSVPDCIRNATALAEKLRAPL